MDNRGKYTKKAIPRPFQGSRGSSCRYEGTRAKPEENPAALSGNRRPERWRRVRIKHDADRHGGGKVVLTKQLF